MFGVPKARVLWVGFGTCLAVIGLYLALSAFEPFRTNWGDPWSDGNAMTSGRYFASEGFFSTAFTPILDVGPIDADSLRYTHYPPLPDLVAGVVQSAIGPDHLTVHRLLALVWTAIALVFFFRYVEALLDRPTAAIAVLVAATNLLFVQYADTIHHIPLYMMTGFGTLVAAVRWLDGQRPSALVAAAVGTFFCFLSSYDYYFFLSTMLLATVWFRGARFLRGHGLLLILVYGGAALASIVVKNVLVIWAEGYDHWIQDLVFQFFERATSAHSQQYEEGVRDVVLGRTWRFFTPVFFVAMFAQLVAVVDCVRGYPASVSPRPLAFLLAGVPFLFVFTQLVVEQYHPMMLLLPFAAVSIAALVRATWRSAPRIAAALLALYIGWQVRQFALFEKGYIEPDDVAKVREVLAKDDHRFVMTNIFVDGPVRYLLGRHLFGIILDPMAIRDQFDSYGASTPMTIVQLKGSARHLYDKGVYSYFVAERRWAWISRPDAYRKVMARRFDTSDRMLDEALADIGTLVHDSPTMRIRTITDAQLTELQRRRMPNAMPAVIDFADPDAVAYKRRGIGGATPATDELPGFSLAYPRQPAKLVFTLRGYRYPPQGKPNATSELELPMPAGHAVTMTITLSTSIEAQTVAVRVNGRELARQPLAAAEGLRRLEVTIPVELLRADGRQVVELQGLTSHEGLYEIARLHRIELVAIDG